MFPYKKAAVNCFDCLQATKKLKEKKKPVMHNAVAHHLLTDAQAVIRLSRPTPPFIYWA